MSHPSRHRPIGVSLLQLTVFLPSSCSTEAKPSSPSACTAQQCLPDASVPCHALDSWSPHCVRELHLEHTSDYDAHVLSRVMGVSLKFLVLGHQAYLTASVASPLKPANEPFLPNISKLAITPGMSCYGKSLQLCTGRSLPGPCPPFCLGFQPSPP